MIAFYITIHFIMEDEAFLFGFVSQSGNSGTCLLGNNNSALVLKHTGVGWSLGGILAFFRTFGVGETTHYLFVNNN